jgi:pimeloyl-ACP methyl ester carboxylesterase
MFEQRAMESETAQLAVFPLLSEHFTVYHYDRRGRGDSNDTAPYAVEREIEDIEALINDAGGTVYLFGISSGAALALEATIKLGDKVKKLAIYDPPYNDEKDARESWKAFRHELADLIGADRRGDAVALFMSLMGVPEEHLAGMREMPMWPMWEAIAPTIAYDAMILGEDASIPTKAASKISGPTLVINGGESYPFMQETGVALAEIIAHSQHRLLEGQKHEVAPEAVAPILVEYFTA